MTCNHMVTILKLIALACLVLLCTGCAAMDFGGPATKESWDFRWGWNQSGISIGEEDPNNPGFDRAGNLIPDDDVKTTYEFPDVTAGYAAILQPDARTTPVIGMEGFEFRVPHLRWFSVQGFAGTEVMGAYMGKRFTSIYEITGGVFYGRDQRANKNAWGVMFTLLKF